jgi:hypothetical protein
VAASLAINGTMGGDTAGAAISNSSATATTAALGIGGGEGADTINNQRHGDYRSSRYWRW